MALGTNLVESAYVLANNDDVRRRVANRPGMAGTVPELTSFVPCPGLGYFCPGSY